MVNRLGASLTDDARVIIYDHHMFRVQATGDRNWQLICSNWDMLRTWIITNTNYAENACQRHKHSSLSCRSVDDDG